MLHACNAVDGTAAKLYPKEGSNARFTTLLRENYHILGPMSLPGINLAETRWPVDVKKPKAPGGKPDLADLIYGIYRCCEGHGEELPDRFELIPNSEGSPGITNLIAEKGKVRLSDRIIFGLLAVAITSPVNSDQKAPDGYNLIYGGKKLLINDLWGRSEDFSKLTSEALKLQVKVDFGDWMEEKTIH